MLNDGLHKLVQDFIKEHGVSCSEAIYDNDAVIENAYELLEKMFDIVGYDKVEEDEND